MEYTVIIKGHSYDLPKRTISVMEELDEMAHIDNRKELTLRDKFNRLFKFISKLVGKEAAIEILGTDNVNEMDTSEITIAFQKIVDAYQRPIREYQLSQADDALGSMPIDELKALKEIIDSQKVGK